MTDTVITVLLNRFPDPQYAGTKFKDTDGHWPADIGLLTVMPTVVAVAPDAHRVILSDCLEPGPQAAGEVIRAESDIPNAYFARWVVIAEYLQTLDPDDRVWCVDGGDVEMLSDPFPSMRSDFAAHALYLGSEPIDGPNARNLGFWWCRDFHPDSHDLIDSAPDAMLYNPGLVGGTVETVMEFATELALVWPTADGTDVLAANRLAYGRFAGRVLTGFFHTRMWHFERTPGAFWRHK